MSITLCASIELRSDAEAVLAQYGAASIRAWTHGLE